LENTPTTSSDPTPSPHEADARAKIATLRAMAADFTAPEPRNLTTAEKRVINATPRVFVEKTVNFGQTVPVVTQATKADFADMRDGEEYAAAYTALIDELGALQQLVRKAVALRRLKSARIARSIYRMAKSYVLTEGGDDAKTHVQEMKKALRRPPRTGKTPASPPTLPQLPAK
jgi:hypothetical protein